MFVVSPLVNFWLVTTFSRKYFFKGYITDLSMKYHDTEDILKILKICIKLMINSITPTALPSSRLLLQKLLNSRCYVKKFHAHDFYDKSLYLTYDCYGKVSAR